MLNFESLADISSEQFARGTAVAIGKFDGVHLGHQALLARAAKAANQCGLDLVVFTFAENPQQVLNPQRALPAIVSHDQRLASLQQAGATACVMVPFDGELAAMSPEQFAREVLVGLLRAQHLVVGRNFRFGHGGQGDTHTLTALGQQLGFTVEVIGMIEVEGIGRVSSSRVRELLLEGDVAQAARLLGRPLEVRGTVVRGDARGRELGFPTANLGAIEGLAPAEGVYAARAQVRGAWLPAAVSVGNNPTFTPEGESRVEVYLIDFAGDIYGEPIAVQFIERLRGNIVFTGIDALIAQMHDDVARSREILGAHEVSPG